MTPYEIVEANFQFPEFIRRNELQVQAVNATAPLNNSGHWNDMGTGKTLVATACALYHRISFGTVCLVVVPPLLIAQWGRWLRSIKPALSVVEYRGTPKQRAELTLDADFVIVGAQIFKKEFPRFWKHYHGRPFTTIVDEATMLGNVDSDTHEKLFDFVLGQPVMLLSGTPINKPGDGYALIKFTAPGTYRNLVHFENMHVEERDLFKMPTKYRNLDVLKENLMKNSVRILFEDMYKDVEAPLFDPLHYDLHPDHYKLYRKLADEQILKLPDGGKIDASTVSKLRHNLGQIITNWGHFSGDPGKTSDSVALIEQKLNELGTGKLVVFANYRMTVSVLRDKLKKYGAVSVNSEVSAAQKDKNVKAFTTDPKCRVIIIQFASGGFGLDGLQHVCNHAIFIEPCEHPRNFHQCVGRLKRTGQRLRVMIFLAIARGTLQIRGFNNLLKNDATVNKVIRTAIELRKEIYGEDR